MGAGALGAARAVTQTDLLKLAGLVLVAFDHWGLYFDEEVDAWRVVGRTAAPIFFFLIGLAGGRRVPGLWLALGAGLSATEITLEGEFEPLNILLNFALLRLIMLRLPEAWLLDPVRAAILVLACAALVPVLDPVLEYGAEGWLWALAGLAARVALATSDPVAARIRIGVTAAAALVYWGAETVSYGFDPAHSAALAIAVTGLALALATFRPGDLSRQPGEPAASVLRFAGRRSLELYALNLFLSQVIAHAISDG